MDPTILRKRINMIAIAMAVTFLIIHVAMLIIFAICGVTPMIYINVGSVIFYGIMVFLIHKSHLTLFSIATYFEIAIHMALAIIFTGWSAGFQITIIGIVILLFFCEYSDDILRVVNKQFSLPRWRLSSISSSTLSR